MGEGRKEDHGSSRAAENGSAKPQRDGECPPPPWPVGSAANSKRVGWEAYFAGRRREDCPFPLGRRDLQAGYRQGWDYAYALTLPVPPRDPQVPGESSREDQDTPSKAQSHG